MVYEPGFGEWLSKKRRTLGLTQKELAHQINIAAITLRKIEAEQRKPSVTIAQTMARALAIPADQYDSFIRFARGDWQSVPVVLSASIPLTDSTSGYAPLLPFHRSGLVGREKEIDGILRTIADERVRLVTLIGPPGVGKSRLADEVAHRLNLQFPARVRYLDLAAVDDPGLLDEYLFQSVDLDRLDSPFFYRPERQLAGKSIILVIDNAEHVAHLLAHRVDQLVQKSPGLQLLVTSREAFHIDGEVIFSISPLEYPHSHGVYSLDAETISQFSAVKLFVNCAQAVHPGFMVDLRNAHDIAAICDHLDGLPLALELFASRMRIMTPHALLSRLNSHFMLHSTLPRCLPVYHQTLQLAIDRSYSLLTLDEKLLFTYLSIFNGEFSLEMVESAFSATPPHNVIADLLLTLVAKSLIQVKFNQDGEPLFSMLTTIHNFATVHLRDFEQDDAAHIQFPLEVPGQSRAMHNVKYR
jgi:predicted ATPase/DNA-binding XRE family transcriptional regulator